MRTTIRLGPIFLTQREISAYILDFPCVYPFRDGNGRIARLLTLLLLYQGGFEVGRYISLEKLVERTKESYYDTLQQSSAGWHEGTPLEPWTEYLLGVIVLSAYREFEQRVGQVAAGRGTKTALVLEFIDRVRGEFAISDVQARCPTVGVDLIRRILKREREADRLECLGRGPNAQWRRTG